MGDVSAAELLRRPVEFRGVQLGRPVDVVLDVQRRRALGLEVLCGDDSRRFLPLAAVAIRPGAIEIRSPLVLLEEAQLAFYTERGSTYRGYHGEPVVRAGELAGTVEDVLLAADGSVQALVVTTPGGRQRVIPTGDAAVGGDEAAVQAAC